MHDGSRPTGRCGREVEATTRDMKEDDNRIAAIVWKHTIFARCVLAPHTPGTTACVQYASGNYEGRIPTTY